MADLRYKDASGAPTSVIDDNATLADGARAAGDYDNSANLDLFCVPYLTVQYDGGPPTANTKVAELYLLPGNADGTEKFPEGGDAGLGTDDDPQACFLVGSFESINPSLTVDEVLALPPVRLYPHGNRFVLKNTSGQTFDLTWQLEIMRFKYESN